MNGKIQISVSLTAQLPTCKKGLLDKIRKTPFFCAQGQGWGSQVRPRSGPAMPFGAFSPHHHHPPSFAVVYFRCVNASLQNHIPLLGSMRYKSFFMQRNNLKRSGESPDWGLACVLASPVLLRAGRHFGAPLLCRCSSLEIKDKGR